RIAIARALLLDPEILILDDAVSAVDTDTEERILRHLRETRAGKTNIIIAHRISTLQGADEILVIDEGKIAERGDHEQLLAQNGIYADMYHRQLLEKMKREEYAL
ncbi:MAG: ABC transporter ATP-binding protein, partial [Clostridia bacterium]|nr:ABC transporter ATP-binding protein [Clostridia bacterium]